MKAAAHGSWGKLVWLMIGFAAFVGLSTYYVPFSQGYEVKNAAKLACNEIIRDTRNGVPHERKWQEPFLRRATQAGARLQPDDYSFEVKQDRQNDRWVCAVWVTFPTTTSWAYVGDVLDLAPLQQQKTLRFEHEVRDHY